MKQKISQKVRAEVLWDAGHRTAKSMKRRGNIPIRSAERYISSLKKNIPLEKNNYQGRRKLTQNPSIVKKVIRKAESKTVVPTLRNISKACGISPNSAKTILNQLMFTYKRYKKRLVMNEDIRKERIEFAKKMIQGSTDWNSICFTDESSFWLSRSQPSKGWSKDHSQQNTEGYKGIKIHCWGGITSRGTLKIELFQENLNSKKYCEIIKKKAKELKILYPLGCTWQQDNSSVHASVKSEDMLTKKFDSLLDFPSYSPDISPIENIWAWLKNEVSKDQPATLDSLKTSIRKNWRKITPEFLQPYFTGMQERMQNVVKNEGYSINK